MPDTFVIVGASLAGAKAAETLRAEGFGGTVILIGAEAERPYERPPLSKDYLLGKAERDSVFVHPPDWYDEHEVDLRMGVTVSAIDRRDKRVELSDGASLGYTRLLLATGSAPRRLVVNGGQRELVLYLRTLADSEALHAAIARGGQVVIAGAGWIGLELAAAARLAGCEVTVVEPEPVALHRQLGPELGEVFASLHRGHGVAFRFGQGVAELRGDGAHGPVREVITSAGESLPADLVVAGIGATPNDALAARAELATGNGVLTDESLRTSDPDIFAAGDVARAQHPLLGRRIRVEHWANALNGGPAAARSMLGHPVSYDRVPYFYTDQYDLGMECAGVPEPGTYDEVVYRGDRESGEFIAFWLSDGAVVAGMNVNIWDVQDDIEALIRSAAPVNVKRLTDPGVPLAEV